MAHDELETNHTFATQTTNCEGRRSWLVVEHILTVLDSQRTATHGQRRK